MAEVRQTIDIADRPAAVWAVAGDPGAVHHWHPSALDCRLDGDLRYVNLANGGEAVERIISRDDAAYSYEYEFIKGPYAFSHYRSSFSVEPRFGGSRVEWRAELGADDKQTEARLISAISASYRSALAMLKQNVEMR